MKFEYKTMPVEGGPLSDEAMNKLGSDSWRLVNCVVLAATPTRGLEFVYVFIREKPVWKDNPR